MKFHTTCIPVVHIGSVYINIEISKHIDYVQIFPIHFSNRTMHTNIITMCPKINHICIIKDIELLLKMLKWHLNHKI